MARRGGWRRRIVLLLALAMVAGAIYTAVGFLQRSETLITERCTAAGAGGEDLATDQAANAALISAIAVRRGLPARAASIALATSMQESKLRNVGHGDQAGPDSRGLFQQRPSQGWGTEAQVLDPYHATNAFYDALEKVPGYQVDSHHRGRAAGPAFGVSRRLRPARAHGPCLRVGSDGADRRRAWTARCASRRLPGTPARSGSG